MAKQKQSSHSELKQGQCNAAQDGIVDPVPVQGQSVPVSTEVAVVIDRSGSMQPLTDDTIGGFKSFLEEQQKLQGEANLTVVQFNHNFEQLYSGPLREGLPLTPETYVAQGTTALLDAVGRTVTDLKNRIDALDPSLQPSKVIVAILTDGAENSSTDYSREMVNALIEERKTDGWLFLFLAANQDAFAAGRAIGVPRNSTFNYAATAQGVRSSYQVVSDAVSDLRRHKDSPAPNKRQRQPVKSKAEHAQELLDSISQDPDLRSDDKKGGK